MIDYRSSPPEMFLGKGVQNIYTEHLQENTHAEERFQ